MSMFRLNQASFAEQTLLFEMVESSFTKLCISDWVRFDEKVWKTKGVLLNNEAMMLVKSPETKGRLYR